jgi:hypothetical protein
MFYSTGTLAYSDNPYKLILEVDQGLSDYYRSLIPKFIKINKQMFAPHISVIRNENITNFSFWNRHQGQIVIFEYENYIYNDELYYWLGAYSKQLEQIRLELGLTPTSFITESPDSGHKFHITLGNLKNKTP